MPRRPEQDYYCPRCGAPVRYIGFYRCTGTGCGVRVEISELATAGDAARLRAGDEEAACDVLF